MDIHGTPFRKVALDLFQGSFSEAFGRCLFTLSILNFLVNTFDAFILECLI